MPVVIIASMGIALLNPLAGIIAVIIGLLFVIACRVKPQPVDVVEAPKAEPVASGNAAVDKLQGFSLYFKD